MDIAVQINSKGQLRRAARKLLVNEPEKLLDYPPLGWSKKAWAEMCRKPYTDRLLLSAQLLAAEMERVVEAERKGVLFDV